MAKEVGTSRSLGLGAVPIEAEYALVVFLSKRWIVS